MINSRFAAILGLFISATSFAAPASFWVWDLTVMPPGFRNPSFDLVATTPLRGEREKANVWIEQNLGAKAPTIETVGELNKLLTEHTPEGSYDKTRGILEIETEIFGQPPVPPSGDRDFHIMIAGLKPFENGQGMKFGFDGFFNVFDQFTEAEAQKNDQHSNERNIVYVNAYDDLGGEYMQGVVAHELTHLINFGKRPEADGEMEPWVNEMLAEGAMQLTGFYSDTAHVEAYRQHPEWPLALAEAPVTHSQTAKGHAISAHLREIDVPSPLFFLRESFQSRAQAISLAAIKLEAAGFRITYGGLSMLAEFLLTHYPADRFGRLAYAGGTGFEQFEKVYGKPWNTIFADYVAWLFEQKPVSKFHGSQVAAREQAAEMKIGTSGVIYLSKPVDTDKLAITATPKSCTSSNNVLRTRMVSRGDADTATALWVESTPPCATTKGMSAFEQDAFVIRGR